MIDITGIDKAELLAALYNSSHAQGLGVFRSNPATLSVDEARELLEKYKRFDYLKGRVMKIDLSGDELDPRLYDRDVGQGACQRAVTTVRNKEGATDDGR